MWSFLKSCLSQDSSVSSMRIMSFIALFAAIGVTAYGMYRAFNLTELSLLVGVFIGAAFGGKAYQKKIELDKDNKG